MKKTIENLSKAFAGESQARNRYTFYAKVAKKEGYEQVSANFLLTADQEREHAKWLLRMINQLKANSEEDFSDVKVEADIPNVLGNTVENLKAAIGGENHEFTAMYPEFAQIADEEGLSEVAKRLRSIAKAEEYHSKRYQKFLKNIEEGAVFKRPEPVTWVCRNCGYTHDGEEAPDKCSSCDHPKAYFQKGCY